MSMMSKTVLEKYESGDCKYLCYSYIPILYRKYVFPR
jgi:hypothetical protein